MADEVLRLLGRQHERFAADVAAHAREIASIVQSSRFLVIGAAGSIGRAVTVEILRRTPRLLHVVDLSENNLVELERDFLGSIGYADGEFAAFAIDAGSDIFDAFLAASPRYTYVLNFSALKHQRSERDPYTLMRMIDVNILNADRTLRQARARGVSKYFYVSTDQAANPTTMMGASKRIMQTFLMRRSLDLPVSSARLPNVAFSDGSLLFGFHRRMERDQPLSVPHDVRRDFVTPRESAELCLLSCLLGENRDVFFSKLEPDRGLITFSELAERFLAHRGYEAVPCATEDEARARVAELKVQRKWPVYYFPGDTTGDKDSEELHTKTDTLDMNRFSAIGVIKGDAAFDATRLDEFERAIRTMRARGSWTRGDLIELFNRVIPEFTHREAGTFLDGRM